jgi:hypothetical protein
MWGLAILALAMGMSQFDGWIVDSHSHRIQGFDAGDWSMKLAEEDRLGNRSAGTALWFRCGNLREYLAR